MTTPMSLGGPGNLNSNQPVDVENKAPAEKNEPVERPESEDTPPPPAFEDD